MSGCVEKRLRQHGGRKQDAWIPVPSCVVAANYFFSAATVIAVATRSAPLVE
jgi:hypothetical protein